MDKPADANNQPALLIPAAEIHREQIKLLFNALPISLLVTMLNAVILSAVQWPVIDQRIITGWLTGIILVNLYRGFSYLKYRKSAHNHSDSQGWENLFMLGSLPNSILWGAGSYLLFPENDIAHQAFIAFVMAGMSAGATTSLSFIRKYIFIYLTALLIPLIYQFFNESTQLSNAMGLMICLFYLMVSISSKRIYENTLQNITMRLEAVQRGQQLSSYHQKQMFHVQRTPLGYIEWDPDFNVQEWNPAAEKIFGFTREQALGKNAFEMIVPKEEAEHVNTVWQALIRQQGGIQSSNKNTTQAGNTIYCEWYNTPLVNGTGDVVSIASLVEDVTDRRLAEINLLQAKEEAEQANNAKSQFLSRMSHELRTPLNAIYGFSQLLESDDENLKDDQRECVHHIIKASNHLLHLIDEVLDIVSVDNNELRFNIETLAVKPLILNTIQMVSSLAEKNHVTINEVNGDNAWLKADEPRLVQVLVNLLRNAILYNKPGGQVTIQISTTDHQFIRISITDTGLGIREEDQHILFEPFHRTIITDRSIEGKGIGLSISKKLVEAMDGRIGVDSRLNQGSTFWLELPLSQSAVLPPTD